MFGRIFGRGKDETDPAVCAQCGRTLLVGEWTQNVVGADGQEYLICSLCGQSATVADVDPVSTGTTPANNGRVRESRSDLPQTPEPAAGPAPAGVPVAAAAGFAAVAEPAEERRDGRTESDAFWRALKEKDAEIDRLQAELARMDAEKQELAAQLAAARARLGGQATETGVPQAPLVPAAAALAIAAQPDAPVGTAEPAFVEPVEPPRGDASEPGERTWGETPAEFASELAALREEEAALHAGMPVASDREMPSGAPDVAPAVADPVPPIVFETTQPIPALTDDMIVANAAAAGPVVEEAETTLTPAAGVPVAMAVAEPPAGPTPAEIEAEAADLTLLQRGVDLLNVSPVPHKIAETSGQLGLPMVNVGSDGQSTVITFLWTMGWYRYDVDSDSGAVRMTDRGYDERSDLRPNATVRADGTVQLAPAQISRAAKAPAEHEPAPAAPAAPTGPTAQPAEPEPPSVAAQKAPEILSKSLLGQRSDDDVASWEQTQARDFDWNR
jgi:hypothetical protein